MYGNGRGVPQSDKEAVKWYRKAAEQGDADAQSNLDFMYDNVQGVPQSDKEAVKWYRKAAEQGKAGAQCNLGFMFKYGRGVPQSNIEASKWYRKAAEQGDVIAQSNLGLMYENGRGVPKNDTEAMKWLQKAAVQGDSNALEYLEELKLKMNKRSSGGVISSLTVATVECGHCGLGSLNLRSCSRCKTVSYCCRECQVAHWKAGHKGNCSYATD